MDTQKKPWHRSRNTRQAVPLTVLLALAGLALSLDACVGTPPTGRAMATLAYPWQDGQRQDSLVIMLPGINNSPTAFSAAGMVTELQKNARVDVVAVDANFKYYMDRSVVDRLHDELIKPAQKQGYQRIWLVGASMGGFGCLLYTQKYPGDIEGIVLLAPFLGEGLLEKELQTSGGLANWHYQPGSGKDEQDRKVREIWFWLQQYFDPAIQPTPDEGKPRIWLGWGSRDKFRGDAARLAAIMPADQSLTIDGAHDWPTWAKLFGQFIPELGLPPTGAQP